MFTYLEWKYAVTDTKFEVPPSRVGILRYLRQE